MKIAMVSEHASPLAAIGGVDAGGQNVHVAALSGALGDQGHEVVVHTRRDDRRLPARVRTGARVVVDHIDAGPPAPIPKDDIYPYLGGLAEGLRARWQEDRPSVVHSHFWMSGVAALRAAASLGIPVVHTFHALGTVKKRHQGPMDTSPPERIAHEVAITGQAARIVATCSDELFELARMGADVGRVTVVPCGVDTALFRPGPPRWEAPRPSRRHRIVTVGRLVERKGIDDVIRALPMLADTELLVAGGPGPEELARDADVGRLARLAADCGVADRVVIMGRVTRHEVPAIMASADVAVCVPWYEPFGIVPLEAMACSVPVVASAVGGLTDTVIDGVTGVLVPPRDPAHLAAVLRALLAAPARRAAMGRQGRDRVLERYGWPKVAEATAAAYERAVDDHPPQRSRRGRRRAGSALG